MQKNKKYRVCLEKFSILKEEQKKEPKKRAEPKRERGSCEAYDKKEKK